jgi:PiT family inorganic phosphate transporter
VAAVAVSLPWVVLAVAAVFAFVNGVNNGGALVGVGAAGGVVPLEAVALLGAGLLVAPLLVGTRVASTLTSSLVTGPASRSAAAVVLGVLVAMVVVLALNARGLPTSLTLATVGGVVGSGLGGVLRVDWHDALAATAAAALAPLLVGLVTPLALRVLSRLAGRPHGRLLARGAFAVQALAYGANDGQRMLAVVLLGAGAGVAPRYHSAAALVAVPALFCLGALVGARRVGLRLTRRFSPDGPLPGAASQLVSALSAFGAAAAGTPVSMTQSTAAGLIGAQARRGWRHVRWEEVTRLVGAVVVTLPVALLAGVAAGRLVLT